MTDNNAKCSKGKLLITVIALVLMVAIVVGMCVSLFRKDNGSGEEVTFNIDVPVALELDEVDFKNSISTSISSLTGLSIFDSLADDSDDVYIHLISYDESTKELVIFASSEDFSSGLFIRSRGFAKSDVAGIAKSESIYEDYFLENRYEAYLFMSLDISEDDSPEYKSAWMNLWTLFVSIGGSVESVTDISDVSVPAPTATLKFDTKGTLKPTDNLMNAIIKNK